MGARARGELLVLLTNVTEDSTSLAERIRSCVEKQTIVTISIGYCKYIEGMEASEVINNAVEHSHHLANA